MPDIDNTQNPATTTASPVATAAAPLPEGMAVVTLETPLKRGAQTITELRLRKPNAGALRNISLAELLQMNVSALQMVLPRISEPALVKHEVDQMDAVDLVACAMEVAGFLVPKASRESLEA